MSSIEIAKILLSENHKTIEYFTARLNELCEIEEETI